MPSSLTADFFQNPRLSDENGDIGPCDSGELTPSDPMDPTTRMPGRVQQQSPSGSLALAPLEAPCSQNLPGGAPPKSYSMTTSTVIAMPSSSRHDEVFQVEQPSKEQLKGQRQRPTPSSPRRRDAGWNLPTGLYLRGGADTMSNGTTGWGPPPPGGAANASATNGGWGAAPPPNPTASAAWGNPGNSGDPPPTDAAPAQPQPPKSASGAPPVSQQPPPSSSASVTPAAQTAAPGAGQTSTSWAAAAGKGLPANDSNGATNSASKQLEQLNSVREALFSQDGWGGSNVKQDTSWDVEGRPNGQDPTGASSASAGGAPKDTNMWNAHRNDGTDLWKTNLSGQPPAPKPQPANPWGHSPQNPTDYKQWGEEDDGASNNQYNNDTPVWRSDQPNHYNKPPQNDSWKDPRSGMPSNSWNDVPSNNPSGRDLPPHDGWGAPPSQRGQPNNGGQWGGGGGGNGPRWDQHDSPTMQRRPNQHGGMDDIAGTSVWGGKANNGNTSGPNNSASKWQDMPNMPSLVRGPPLPPGAPVPPGGPRGMMPKEPWGHGGGGGGGPPHGRWGDDGPKTGWGGDDMKRDGGGGWGNDNQWNKGPRGMPGNIRTSPNSWDDGGMDQWGGPHKPGMEMPKNPNMHTKEVIWNSKQFRILCDMGYRKDESENALRQSNLRLEDAIEILSNHGARRGPQHDPGFGDPHMGQFHYPPDSQQPGMLPMTRGNLPPQQQPPHRPQQQPSSQPSTQQLRILVQQIQMAVQAGHLNPQILNQPLAPQTLILLNQLLQQIKQLQGLQNQHMNPRGNPNGVMSVTVNITKTKQHITNLQNQISAQQALYLKSQMNPTGPPNMPPVAPAVAPGAAAPETHTNTVQDMFNGLSLMGQDAASTSNGSRLAQWKFPKDFPKAPGTSQASKPNLMLDNGLWGRGSEANGSGWPETSKAPSAGGDGGGDNFGIPEFEPGKPWKGTGMKNPDEDPNLTPGSVAAMPIGPLSKAGSSTTLATSSAGIDSALGLTSPTWSFGNPKTSVSGPSANEGKGDSSWPASGNAHTAASGLQSQIGQDIWGGGKANNQQRAAPPGLVPTSGGWPAAAANGWAAEGSAWLLLKNLTPQIDGSTLKTLCMQHGPLQHFDLYLSHSIALVMYASAKEGAKAQKALNNCLLSNTTIHAQAASESEVSAILQQLGLSSNGATGNNGGNNGSANTPTRGNTPLLPKASAASDTWSDGANAPVTSSGGGGALFNASGSVWGAPDNPAASSASALHPYLPGDLLQENNL